MLVWAVEAVSRVAAMPVAGRAEAPRLAPGVKLLARALEDVRNLGRGARSGQAEPQQAELPVPEDKRRALAEPGKRRVRQSPRAASWWMGMWCSTRKPASAG